MFAKSFGHFLLGCLFSYSWEFLIFSGLESFVGYVIHKHFLPICGLSFHSLNNVFCRAEVFILMKSNLSFFSFMDCAFGVIPAVLNFLLILLRLWTVSGCGFQAAAVQGVWFRRTSCSVPLWPPLGHCSHQLEPLDREEHWPITDTIPPENPVRSVIREKSLRLALCAPGVGQARSPAWPCTFYIAVFIYFWLRRVFTAAWGLSPVVVSEGYTLLRSTGSKWAGFSSFGTWP